MMIRLRFENKLKIEELIRNYSIFYAYIYVPKKPMRLPQMVDIIKMSVKPLKILEIPESFAEIFSSIKAEYFTPSCNFLHSN